MLFRQLKELTVIALSVVFVYYGVAWAVLKCFHEDASSPIGAYSLDTEVGFLEPEHAPTNLECLGGTYRTESMAASSSTVRVFDRSAQSASNFNGFLTLQLATANLASDLWLRFVFERAVTSFVPIRLPRHLSLSVFRI
jgi:hypothetical protein